MKDIAYNHPVDPCLSEYCRQLEDFKLKLAWVEQVHICHSRQCLVTDHPGKLRCKHRAFPCYVKDFVDEKGNWGSKQLYGYMNGWIPGILVNTQYNNDGKLLTNGEDT